MTDYISLLHVILGGHGSRKACTLRQFINIIKVEVISNKCTVEACSPAKGQYISCVVGLLCLYVYIAVMLLSYSKFSILCKINTIDT